jgi:hypothetical protein
VHTLLFALASLSRTRAIGVPKPSSRGFVKADWLAPTGCGETPRSLWSFATVIRSAMRLYETFAGHIACEKSRQRAASDGKRQALNGVDKWTHTSRRPMLPICCAESATHNSLQIAAHLQRYFEMRQSRKTRPMNAPAAQRKVSYADRNADLGSEQHDDQNSTVNELRGRASVPIGSGSVLQTEPVPNSTMNRVDGRLLRASKWSYSIAADPLISRSRTLFHAA